VVSDAGSGIGRAVSLALAQQGADIALVDVDASALSAVRAEVEAIGRKASTHLVDVSSRQQMAALPEQVIAEHGAVHILVNNAGVAVNKAFEQQTADDIENLSSSAGLSGMKGQSSCAATKFAVRGLSECLYVELVNNRVGITCVHPGAVATNILEAARLIVRAIRKNRFKLVFCVESPLLKLMRHLTPVGTLKLMHLANRLAVG
jgi:NAD(P)-dependent dehydrogenase (short-subunit alcohol dehydrogenase family)